MIYPFFKVIDLRVDEIDERDWTAAEKLFPYNIELQESILAHGISRPVVVHRLDDKFFVQDGHNRVKSVKYNSAINAKLKGSVPAVIINRHRGCVTSSIIAAAGRKGLHPLGTINLRNPPRVYFA
jgi:ParB-like nuclease domain